MDIFNTTRFYRSSEHSDGQSRSMQARSTVIVSVSPFQQFQTINQAAGDITLHLMEIQPMIL